MPAAERRPRSAECPDASNSESILQAARSYRWQDVLAGLVQRHPCSSVRFASKELVRILPWPGHRAVPSLHRPVPAEQLPQMLSCASQRVSCFSSQAHLAGKLVQQLDACLHAFSPNAAPRDTWLLSAFAGNEAQVRMLLDIILVRVCQKQELRIKPEHALPWTSPFAGKADYVLFRNERPVAVVEAKRRMNPNFQEDARNTRFVAAMAQCSAILAGFDMMKPATPFYGIVTDAHGWLLVQWAPDKKPALQLWPQGQAILELTGPGTLVHLLKSLQHLFKRQRFDAPCPQRFRNP